jgi:hypothetical protein
MATLINYHVTQIMACQDSSVYPASSTCATGTNGSTSATRTTSDTGTTSEMDY